MKLKINTKFSNWEDVVLKRDLGKEDAEILMIYSIIPMIRSSAINFDNEVCADAIWYDVYHRNGAPYGIYRESDLVSEHDHIIAQKMIETNKTDIQE